MKPLEYWIALATGVLVVIERHRGKSWRDRLLIAAISGGIGFSLSGEVSAYFGRSQILTVLTLTVMGYLVIVVSMEIVTDTAFWKKIIQKRLGDDEK